MRLRKTNSAQVAPCIEAKAKIALGLPTRSTGNKKSCSPGYWEEVVTDLGRENNLEAARIERAIDRTDLYQ